VPLVPPHFFNFMREQHGLTGTPEYHIWEGMKQRCTNPKSPEYCNYGERGILLCDRWHSFSNFIADMGFRPDPSLSIERLDNNKGYEPGNCVWASLTVQNRNRRNNHNITFDGRTQCITVWAQEYEIGLYVLEHRLKRGWSVERALNTPTQRRTISAEERSERTRRAWITRRAMSCKA